MQTCIKCMKFTEPEVIVIERSPRYLLCDKCGVSMVDLVERMPLDIVTEDETVDPPEPPEDTGEISEVEEKAPKKAKKSKKK